MKELSSFSKYIIVGVIKVVAALALFWFFIDYLAVEHKTTVRFFIFLFIFLSSHYIYKWIGYAT